MKKSDFTIASNKGKNKTRANENAALKGKDYKAKKKVANAVKAITDAKKGISMSDGHAANRSNLDTLSAIRDAKREIKGQSSYDKKSGTGSSMVVDKFEQTKKSLGMNNVGDGRVGGTKRKKLKYQLEGRMNTSENC